MIEMTQRVLLVVWYILYTKTVALDVLQKITIG